MVCSATSSTAGSPTPIGFAARPVREVMVPRDQIVAIDRSAPLPEVEHRLLESGHSRLPIYDRDIDHVLGFVHVKDLLAIEGDVADRPVPLRSVRRMLLVSVNRHLPDVLTVMRRSRLHVVLVVDSDGRTAGLVTLEDLLEELVGEIDDETDRPRRTEPNQGAVPFRHPQPEGQVDDRPAACPCHLSRRAVLGGVGAAGVALPAFIAGGRSVGGDGRWAALSNPPAPTTCVVQGNVFAAAAVTPGLSYQTFTGNSFRVRSGDVTYNAVSVTAQDPVELYLNFEHPNGVTIRELEVYVQDVPPGGTAELRFARRPPPTSRASCSRRSPFPAAALLRPSHGSTTTSTSMLRTTRPAVNVTLDGPGKLLGARIGFEDFVGLTFFPVDPSRREIDTRGIRGRLVAFETYRVALKAPPFAFALANLAITQTIAAGFLGVSRPTSRGPVPLASTGSRPTRTQTNLVVVGTDSQGGMNLYRGAGQTHVVVDLQGFDHVVAPGADVTGRPAAS